VQDEFDLGKQVRLFAAATLTPAFSGQLTQNMPRLSKATLSLRLVLRVLIGQCRCFIHGFIPSWINQISTGKLNGEMGSQSSAKGWLFMRNP